MASKWPPNGFLGPLGVPGKFHQAPEKVRVSGWRTFRSLRVMAQGDVVRATEKTQHTQAHTAHAGNNKHTTQAHNTRAADARNEAFGEIETRLTF